MRRHVRTAGRNHLGGPIQKLFNVDTHCGCRGKAKVRERRIATTDAGDAQKDFAKAIMFRFLAEFGPRISDRDEAITDLFVADNLSCSLEKILLEDIRFQRSARLTRNKKQSIGEVDPVFE